MPQDIVVSESLTKEEMKLLILQELQSGLPKAYDDRNMHRYGESRTTVEHPIASESPVPFSTIGARTEITAKATSNDVIEARSDAPNQIFLKIYLDSKKPRIAKIRATRDALQEQQELATQALEEVMQEAGLQKYSAPLSEHQHRVPENTYRETTYTHSNAHTDTQAVEIQFSSVDYMKVKKALEAVIHRHAHTIPAVVDTLAQKTQAKGTGL